MHRIVILGGGFAGLRTAMECEKHCGRFGDCEIVLVDRLAEHVYTPLLYEVATGFLREKGSVCRGELRQGICIGYEKFWTIIGSKHIRFQRAEVCGLNTVAKTVQLKDGELAYDQLVIALGAEPAFYGIPGLQEHALPLKTVADAFAIRKRLHDQLEAYRRGDQSHVRFVVGGAGATGVELAAEAAHFFQALERGKVMRAGDWSVMLVDAAPKILMAFPDDLREEAEDRLRELEVTMMVSAKLKQVQLGSVEIETSNGTELLMADVLAWCGGIQPSSAVALLGLPLGPKGHVDVEPSLQVRGLPGVFALGDCAQIAAGSGFVPPLAQSALEEAKNVAKNLSRASRQLSLKNWNAPKTWPSLLPLGGAFAVGKIGPLRVSGRTAYALRRFVDLQYWLETLPFHQALAVWWNGARTYLKNDSL